MVRLGDNDHALNVAQAVELMKEAYMSTAQDRADFQPCFDKFVMDNPLPAARTPDTFGLAISQYVTNLLAHFSAKNKAGRVNAATEEDPGPHVLQQDVDYQVYLAINKGDNQQPAAIKQKKPHMKKQTTAKLPEPGDPPFYC